MSNIITAYYEIYRVDGGHISQQDRGRIYRGLIKAYDQFASYWVRIYVEYDSIQRCIRIQHGCSKEYGDRNRLLHSEWFSSQFFLWSRWADEGGAPDALSIESLGGMTESTAQILCLVEDHLGEAQYGFDGLLLGGKIHHFNRLMQRKDKFGTRHFLALSGTYEILTSRSMIDMTPEFGGPCLTYETKYRPKRFVPHNYDLQNLNWHRLADHFPESFSDFFVIEPDLDFVTLCWKGHPIHIGSRRGFPNRHDDLSDLSRYPGLSAAGWANLINPAYLAFIAWHAEQVRWADQRL